MDPYGAPAPLWAMPQQGKLYTPLTLTGNWFERRELATDISKFNAKKQARIGLDLDHRTWIYQESNRTYSESPHRENGTLYFGDAIQLVCVGMDPPCSPTRGPYHTGFETPALVIDMSQVDDYGYGQAFAAAHDTQPKGRSVFQLQSEDYSEYPRQEKRICYGDPLNLVSVINWQGLDWRLTSSPQCTYTVNLDFRKQTMWLHPLPTKKSLWSFQHVKRCLRPVMEGQPVDTRQPVLLVHLLTGKNMTVNFRKKFKNNYGQEYLMTCDTDVELNKEAKNNALFNIKPIIFAPWNVDQIKEKEFRDNVEEQISTHVLGMTYKGFDLGP